MSEERPHYGVLYSDIKHDTVDTDAFRTNLEELERRLIAALVTVQRALGKEPTVTTRSERRAR